MMRMRTIAGSESVCAMRIRGALWWRMPLGSRRPQISTMTPGTNASAAAVRHATAKPNSSIEKPATSGPARFETAAKRLKVLKFCVRLSGGLITPTRFCTITRKKANESPLSIAAIKVAASVGTKYGSTRPQTPQTALKRTGWRAP